MNNDEFRTQAGPVDGQNPLPDLSEFTVTAHPGGTFDGQQTDGQPHVFTVDATYGRYEVKVSPSTGYGHFEDSFIGSGGGLWFDQGELTDYDGYACLPKDVKLGLQKAGFVVGEDF